MPQITEVLKNRITSSSFRPYTSATYQRYLDNHIAPFFGDALCSQLDNETVQSFAGRLVESSMSPSTAREIIRFLKSGLAGHYPPGVFDVGLEKKPRTEIRALSASEQKALEKAARQSGWPNRHCVFMCLYTGIRVGELCGLRFEDISFARREFSVQRTVQRVRNTDTGSASKTAVELLPACGHSNRRIPLPGFLLEMLGELRQSAGGKYVISVGGGIAEPRALQYPFKKLLREAGVGGASFQALRHTFAVRALENGIDATLLSKILGHASPFLTYSRYAQLVSEEGMARRSLESMALAMQG